MSELEEGFSALAGERLGKLTLKTHTVELEPLPSVDAEVLLSLRKRLNV